jgi:pimeloyl-ACP methyl ester carboxylesterase
MPELRTTEVSGLTVAHRQAGEGPVLLLLHGAYEDSRIWARVLPGLARDFTVLAVDVPGNGGSDDPPGWWGADEFADAVAELLLGLDLAPVTVAGLSFGSVLALALYRRRPEVVSRLVLASAYAGWAGSLTPEQVEARLQQVLDELERPASEIAPAWLPTLLTEQATPAMRDEVTQVMADFHPAGMRAIVTAFGPLDLRPVLAKIAVPTLLLYGERDVRSPVDPVGLALHEAIPGSRLVVVPDAPHLLMVEAADAFVSHVRDFAT